MPAAVPGAERLLPYRPRRVRHVGVRTLDGWRLKVYVIEAAQASLDDEAAHALVDKVSAELPDLPDGTTGHGLGFVVLHAGEDALWVLVERWVNGDSLVHVLMRGTVGNHATFEDLSGTGLAFCVWEGGVIEFERRAFIDTMMRGSPNPDAYLSMTMDGEI